MFLKQPKKKRQQRGNGKMGNDEAAKEKEQERGKGKMGNDEAKGTTLTFKTGRFWLYLCETVRFELFSV